MSHRSPLLTSPRFTAFWAISAAFALALPALGEAWAAPVPWDRTESREDCSDAELTRQPFFGDTHVHTTVSADALVGGVLTGHREAYDFAKGAPIDLPPYDSGGVALRSAQLRRPLDFTAISDHAEFFGEVQVCMVPGYPGYDDPLCQMYRNVIGIEDTGTGNLAFFSAPYNAIANPIRFDLCGVDAADCLAEASVVWLDIQEAAEEHYDRTAACKFTTFVAYEWTGAPFAQNLHRNVIFRNETVPTLPTSHVEEPTPQGLWGQLDLQCASAATGCEVLAIPHNPNVSNGQLFLPENADGSPIDDADAAFRARIEPIVEIAQHKGDSECRNGVLSNDEACGFEKLTTQLLGVATPGSIPYDPRGFVRNVLKEGLELEEQLGVNPFRLGILASTDTHNSAPGLTNEEDYGDAGHLGVRDGKPEFILENEVEAPLGGIEASGGGLAVVWAEENSRDAIFAAMRRREVYGTSGTRPSLRFFAGNYKSDLCDSEDFAGTAYRNGVPMGGEVGAVRSKKSPAFAVKAIRDPGPVGQPGTPLQVLQIVKGWVDETGTSEEAVFDVAGDANNGATVDTDTCATSGSGDDTLCAVWSDPDFDPSQRAFYYARVLENPTCRWSTHLCNAQGVDCAVGAPVGLEECCNEDVAKTIRERAWSSPIWYRPESFGKTKARIQLKGGGEDTLKISTKMQAAARQLDPDTTDITITVNDGDTIFEATIPAGTMEVKKPGEKWQLNDKAGTYGGIKKAQLKINATKGDAKLQIKSVKTDLSAADALDHFVHMTLVSGTFTTEHQRLWSEKNGKLRPGK